MSKKLGVPDKVKCYSLGQIALHSGVSKSALCRYYNGQGKLSKRNQEKYENWLIKKRPREF